MTHYVLYRLTDEDDNDVVSMNTKWSFSFKGRALFLEKSSQTNRKVYIYNPFLEDDYWRPRLKVATISAVPGFLVSVMER